MRSLRSSLIAILFLAAAGASHAGPVPDSSGVLTTWRFSPESPCWQDSVYMIVRGYVATPCDSFAGAEPIDSLHVRIRRQVYDDRRCFAAPLVFFDVPVGLGRFAPGPHSGLVDIVTRHVHGDGTTSVEVQQLRFGFNVSGECPTPPPPPPDRLPYVDTVYTAPAQPCAAEPTGLVLLGHFRDGCGELAAVNLHDSSNLELTLQLHTLDQQACPLFLKPWSLPINLGTLPAGPHRTNITLHVVDVDPALGALVTKTYYGAHEFFVSADCPPPPPPPPPGPLPYVQLIRVGRVCAPPPCPKDSIPVHVFGVFPDNCFLFRRIVLVPTIQNARDPVGPPIVRIIVDDLRCAGSPNYPCTQTQVPWEAEIKLPPLPTPGDYPLTVELAQVTCSDTFPPGQLFSTKVPFTIAHDCAFPCLTSTFAPPPGNFTACNSTVGPDRPAKLTYLVSPGVALAGLQGEFRLEPRTLRITRIEAIGVAAGMRLTWAASDSGARFVLFADSGAPIPPFLAETYPPGWPVLELTVAQPAGVEAPPLTLVSIENLLGSDAAGQGVKECLPNPCVRIAILRRPAALICADDHGCDFNADGIEDVRDLVTMVHCLRGEGPCPADVGTRFDCDHDSTFTIGDVLCCAGHVLRLPPCPDCPNDSSDVRPEPGIGARFGEAVATAAEVDLPLTLTGSDLFAAMTLRLDAPLDRYQVLGVESGAGPNEWLDLHDVNDGQLTVGLIWLGMRLSGTTARTVSTPTLQLTLRLALKPGASPGGAVTIARSEFSGPDGARLAVSLGAPRGSIPGDQLGLGSSRPNPFSAETRFTLELAAAGNAEVGIYDLRGRAITTLFRGWLPAGPHEFAWSGRAADGTAVANGVYFYRVAVGGKTLGRKLILMRGN